MISKRTDKLMLRLNKVFGSFIESKYFVIASYGFLLNPIFLLFQLIKIIQSSDISGLSILTMSGFIFLQAMSGFVAIKANNFPLLLSMVLSIIITSLIVLIMLFN